MKKAIIALGAALVLCFALVGCGGSGGGSSSSGSSGTTAQGGVSAAVQKYNLNLEGPDEWVAMASEKPLSTEQLGTLYREQLKTLAMGSKSYDEVVAIMGAEPNEFNPAINTPAITFMWNSTESNAKYVRVTFKKGEDGKWTNYAASITNISWKQ